MRLAIASFAIVLVCAASTAWAQSRPEIPALSNSQVQALDAGEILVDITDDAVPTGDAIGVVEASPEAVLDFLRDFDRHAQFMEDITTSRVLWTDGDNLLCRGVTDTPWPMDDRTWTIRQWLGEMVVEGVPVLVNTWEYVPDSGNIVDTQGYWLIADWGTSGDRALVRYHISVDLGTWLPDFLLHWGTANMLPGRIEALRNAVPPQPGV